MLYTLIIITTSKFSLGSAELTLGKTISPGGWCGFRKVSTEEISTLGGLQDLAK